MKAEIKTKWVTALRGGEYLQARKRLKVGDGYCCLGVLCRVLDIEIDEKGDNVIIDGKDMNYSGLDGFIHGDHRTDLISMNDNGSNFDEIADWIETNIPSDAQ